MTAGATAPLILLVEDEWLIATTVAEALNQHGCEVLGPAPTVARALSFLEAAHPHMAIIDFRLARETTEDILPVLDAMKIPVCVLSGYAAAQLPTRYQCYRFLEKPFRMHELFATVDELLAENHPSSG
ncbi:response regulator [Pinirhizobacter sp.]|uniref:response regulator n=1 Tax=Pinirhizobacter sp. TaxID=2950432 RepID=UPI002F419FA6